MKIKITEKMEKRYIEMYQDCFSVSELLRECKDGVGRIRIVRILKNAGVFEGINGVNFSRKRVAKIKKTVQERYGVSNYSKIKSPWAEINKTPYKQVEAFAGVYTDYREKVRKYSKNQIKGVILPNYCFYTGICFIDVEQQKVNPNDPRKRSIDHKKPIIHCFLDGDTITSAGHISNLLFVLKAVNSIKGNTQHESFLPLAEKIRKVFINEGYSHN